MNTLSTSEITFNKKAAVVVISDLHLDAEEPATLRAFLHFIDDLLDSDECGALIVLGDLFEVWIGDDAPRDMASGLVSDAFRTLDQAGKAVYFMHGNRDFLLGTKFAKKNRCTLLPESAVLVYQGHRIALAHGDALCTDDVPYQAFRAQVRSSAWQSTFLGQPLAERVRLARDMRDASERNKQTAGFTDINRPAALALMQAHNAPTLIHGHTHEGKSHRVAGLPKWPDAQRHVTSDWHAANGKQRGRGDALWITPHGIERRRVRV
jgi:UDP-2,3-diacylglucosamine hydrolase